MGSLGAMRAGSKDRYFQAEVTQASKLVPEGIEGRVPYRGSLSESVYQLLGGCARAWATPAAAPSTIFAPAPVRAHKLGRLRESHVHGVIVTKEAPNYRAE
jgi:IMP dehydrogenase